MLWVKYDFWDIFWQNQIQWNVFIRFNSLLKKGMSLKIGRLTDIRYFINNYPNEAIASTLRNYKDIFPFYRPV